MKTAWGTFPVALDKSDKAPVRLGGTPLVKKPE